MPPLCRRLAIQSAPVMDKYGVSVGGLFDHWGAEITLAATALPVALATYQGIKADAAAKKQPAQPAGSKPEPAATPEAEAIPAGALVIPPLNS